MNCTVADKTDDKSWQTTTADRLASRDAQLYTPIPYLVRSRILIEQKGLQKTSRQELAIIGIPIFYRRAAACRAAPCLYLTISQSIRFPNSSDPHDSVSLWRGSCYLAANAGKGADETAIPSAPSGLAFTQKGPDTVPHVPKTANSHRRSLDVVYYRLGHVDNG